MIRTRISAFIGAPSGSLPPKPRSFPILRRRECSPNHRYVSLCLRCYHGPVPRQPVGATLPTLSHFLRVSRPWMAVPRIVRRASTASSTPSSVPSLRPVMARPGAVSVRQDLGASTVPNRSVDRSPTPTVRCATTNTATAMMDGMGSTAMSARRTMRVMR